MGVWCLTEFGTLLLFCSFWLPFVLIVEKKADKRLILNYITYTVYSLTWVPIAIIGIARRHNKEWFHTQHTRTITIKEVE